MRTYTINMHFDPANERVNPRSIQFLIDHGTNFGVDHNENIGLDPQAVVNSLGFLFRNLQIISGVSFFIMKHIFFNNLKL